jgi:hypothetical protein
MQKHHIIFAGCSFSDEGIFEDKLDLNLLKNEISYKSLRVPSTLKIHKYFALDLINQNLSDNFIIHTIARGSYGNHVIFDKLKKTIIDIQSNNPNDKIYTVIQLSSLMRHGIMRGLDIDAFQYPYDYSTQYLYDYESIKNVFIKHIDNIENIHNFCIENNVENKIFFGWANLFIEDFLEYEIMDRVDNLKKIVDFYKYKDSNDEMETYCSGKKPKSNDTILNGLKTYQIPSGEFGGITEYSRDNLSIGRRYNLITDPHPNSNSYYIFYKNILRNWFIEKNILIDEIYNTKYDNILNNIFNFEYIRFMNTLDIRQCDNQLISDISYKLMLDNKLEDSEYIANAFKELNNKMHLI